MKRSRYCKEDNWQRPAVPRWELSSGNWEFGNSVLLPRAWQLPRTSGFSYETSSDAKEAFFSTSREGGVSTWEIGHTVRSTLMKRDADPHWGLATCTEIAQRVRLTPVVV